jgi:hypothetical protein
MTPVNLNEFLIRRPAMLKLRLRVDEAAVAVKHAHIESLRALSDKNAPLISRWHTYFRECDHGHQIFISAFYRAMRVSFNRGLGSVRPIDKEMLRRKLQLDDCITAVDNAADACDRAFHDKNPTLMLRWRDYFEDCRALYMNLLSAFRRDFLKPPPSGP